MTSRYPIRVYYEDTDCGGVVYYANYLRYFERARTEFLRERGVDLMNWIGCGVTFVVVHVSVDYKAPAGYGDQLTIETSLLDTGRASLTLKQTADRTDGVLLVDAVVKLATISAGRPCRLPQEIVARLNGE